jgi:inosine-uridine nucleoside N-ribohydrolase
MTTRTKVLLDTDIGSDIDDAVCLAYLLAQPRCELLGITTVTGQATQRAMLASALCRVAGGDIPIFPGAERPLIVSQRQPDAPQAAALSRWVHDASFESNEAVSFMRRTIRQHPHKVILLTIGPLTNVALLFALDPDIPALLKGLVMMCGVFTHHPRRAGALEWNAILDPHATAMVYATDTRLHRSIGLDVTKQVRMKADEVRRAFQAELLQPVLDFAQVWFAEQDEITFHDPLAAVTLFDTHVCGFEKGRVTVELANRAQLGRTDWDPRAEHKPHEVALTVNSERFFDRFFSVFGA